MRCSALSSTTKRTHRACVCGPASCSIEPAQSLSTCSRLPLQPRHPRQSLQSKARSSVPPSPKPLATCTTSRPSQFTLPELNQRAYFLVHNDDPSRDATHPRHTVGQHPLQGFATTPPELRQLKVRRGMCPWISARYGLYGQNESRIDAVYLCLTLELKEWAAMV